MDMELFKEELSTWNEHALHNRWEVWGRWIEGWIEVGVDFSITRAARNLIHAEFVRRALGGL